MLFVFQKFLEIERSAVSKFYYARNENDLRRFSVNCYGMGRYNGEGSDEGFQALYILIDTQN